MRAMKQTIRLLRGPTMGTVLLRQESHQLQGEGTGGEGFQRQKKLKPDMEKDGHSETQCSNCESGVRL